jgi:hypothetical protein
MYEISTALNEANGSTLGGRSLTVSLAREREKSSNNLKRH